MCRLESGILVLLSFSIYLFMDIKFISFDLFERSMHSSLISIAGNFGIGSSSKDFLTCYAFDRCHFRSSQKSIINLNWRVEESLWKKPKVRDDLKKSQPSKPCYRDDLSNRSEVILSSINDTWPTFPRSIKKKSQDNIHRTGRQYTSIKTSYKKLRGPYLPNKNLLPTMQLDIKQGRKYFSIFFSTLAGGPFAKFSILA